MIYLSVEQVLFLHDRLIEETGGEHGVRDLGGLESALARPHAALPVGPWSGNGPWQVLQGLGRRKCKREPNEKLPVPWGLPRAASLYRAA